ncbi:hypothetical protein MMC14_008907 [Varicellaria rhodocarpa]|nr:hypothetical protein [Varicellaria rhodocarpa]
MSNMLYDTVLSSNYVCRIRFSMGDFVAALELVGTVIDALREVRGAGAEFRSLIHELSTLKTALLKVKEVELAESQGDQKISLQQAAVQCQRTIDDFWVKVSRYQPLLRQGDSGSHLKDGWMKIKWAVCKKEDLAKFKADLMGHTNAIELLLMAVQMCEICPRCLDIKLMQSKEQYELIGQKSTAESQDTS